MLILLCHFQQYLPGKQFVQHLKKMLLLILLGSMLLPLKIYCILLDLKLPLMLKLDRYIEYLLFLLLPWMLEHLVF